MTRDEMIEKLKSVGFVAAPTVATFDMGLQYEYITSTGVGINMGQMGNWPLHKIKSPNKDKWLHIKKKIIDGSLIKEDMKGSTLFNVATMFEESPDLLRGLDLQECLEDLKEFPDELPEYIYCMFDDLSWDDKPSFYEKYDEMIDAFKNYYCDYDDPFDSLSDDELQDWIEKLGDCLAEIPIFIFEETEDEILVDN